MAWSTRTFFNGFFENFLLPNPNNWNFFQKKMIGKLLLKLNFHTSTQILQCMNFGHSCNKKKFFFFFEYQKFFVCVFFKDFGSYQCGNLPSKSLFLTKKASFCLYFFLIFGDYINFNFFNDFLIFLFVYLFKF